MFYQKHTLLDVRLTSGKWVEAEAMGYVEPNGYMPVKVIGMYPPRIVKILIGERVAGPGHYSRGSPNDEIKIGDAVEIKPAPTVLKELEIAEDGWWNGIVRSKDSRSAQVLVACKHNENQTFASWVPTSVPSEFRLIPQTSNVVHPLRRSNRLKTKMLRRAQCAAMHSDNIDGDDEFLRMMIEKSKSFSNDLLSNDIGSPELESANGNYNGSSNGSEYQEDESEVIYLFMFYFNLHFE